MPNGNSGLLVTTFDAFAHYQTQRGSNTAWTWEHQAMTRARCCLDFAQLQDAFEAVRRAIDELAALVGYIVNNLNGHHVVVTADHGFLFTETAPDETDNTAEPRG